MSTRAVIKAKEQRCFRLLGDFILDASQGVQTRQLTTEPEFTSQEILDTLVEMHAGKYKTNNFSS